MNSSSIITALVLAAVGYFVGHQHGGDVARFNHAAATTQTIVADYPYAGVCSEMLQAAWDVRDKPLVGLSHKP